MSDFPRVLLAVLLGNLLTVLVLYSFTLHSLHRVWPSAEAFVKQHLCGEVHTSALVFK